jgi:DNA-binding response OmpR family regulator
MSRLNLLVISIDDETGAWLSERLSPLEFAVSVVPPGPKLIEAARRTRPHLAVLEGIDDRPRSAPLEVAVLKDQSPGVLIIALSEDSSEFDAEVVEQGIFFYLAGRSREELLRVIAAAAGERERGRTLDVFGFEGMVPEREVLRE